MGGLENRWVGVEHFSIPPHVSQLSELIFEPRQLDESSILLAQKHCPCRFPVPDSILKANE